MGRPRTGTIEAFVDASGRKHFRGKVRLGDGSRERVEVPEPYCFDEAKARAFVTEIQKQEDTVGGLLAKKRGKPLNDTSTVRQWSVRWVLSRKARGHTSTRDDESRLEHHIFPRIGDQPMASVPRSEIESIVEDLDAKVQAGLLSWHTALNIWAVVSRMFRDACRAKQRDLRVREDNPALGVEPPDRGARKGKQFLYPTEFVLIAQNDLIPLGWRRLIALAIYLFPRAGELQALEWEDVDLERGIVHIHRSIDRERGSTKSTKTGSPRRFTVEPAALPLLKKMHEERTGDGPVLEHMARHRDLAEGLRTYLEVAGVKRPELFTTDKTRKAITFHDLRATGLTWMAIRGEQPLRIMQRAGHESFATTQLYVREAEAIRDGFGEVFPPLTPLLDRSPTGERSTIGPRRRDLERLKRGVSKRYVAGWTGLESDRDAARKPSHFDDFRALLRPAG